MTNHDLFNNIDTVNPTFEDRLRLFRRLCASFGQIGRSECEKVWECMYGSEAETDDAAVYVAEFMSWDQGGGALSENHGHIMSYGQVYGKIDW